MHILWDVSVKNLTYLYYVLRVLKEMFNRCLWPLRTGRNAEHRSFLDIVCLGDYTLLY